MLFRRSHRPRAPHPRMYAGLRAWFDASLLSGNDGDNLQTWPDTVGGFDAAQLTDALREPTLQVDEKNGLNTIRFEHLDVNNSDVMIVPHELLDALSTCTVFAAFKRNSTTLEATLLSCYAAANRQFRLALGSGATPAVFFDFGGVGTDANAVSNTGLITPTDWNIVTGRASAGQPIQLWVNGQEVTYSAQLNAVQLTTLGADAAIALRVDGGASGLGLDSDVAELLVYSTALTDGERVGVEAFINNKWALGVL